jgi:catechol 2,3-dioxygenase-like lactoylglutathione lyase family enzyme
MNPLINIDVPDLAEAVAFYTRAFGLTVTRHFGAEVAELSGLPVQLYMLQKPAGSVGAGDDRRVMSAIGRRCISM